MIGAVIIVVGLYSVLWGKYNEEKEEKQKMKLQEIPEAIKDNTNTQVNGNIQLITGNTEEKTGAADKCPSVAIDLPLSNPPTKATQKVWHEEQLALLLYFFWNFCTCFTLFVLDVGFKMDWFWFDYVSDVCKYYLIMQLREFKNLFATWTGKLISSK